MKVSAKQIFTAFIAMICTLGVLWGGQRLYQKTVVQSPLIASLGTIRGVSQAHIKNGVVTVRMKPGADLMTVYRTVSAAADQALGHAPASIHVVSHPDAALNRTAQDSAFVVAQGEATGQFVTMKSNILQLAHTHHVNATVELGTHHLFVTFSHQGAVLYQVVPVSIGGGTHG